MLNDDHLGPKQITVSMNVNGKKAIIIFDHDEATTEDLFRAYIGLLKCHDYPIGQLGEIGEENFKWSYPE